MSRQDLHLHRVKFIPVSNGDLLSVPTVARRSGYGSGTMSYDDVGHSHLVGFKPGPSGRASGHLVYLVHEAVSAKQHVRKVRAPKP